jgi:hypothetical protein
VEVIAHRVWLYFRFPLSYREVEELMLQRGVIVSCETVRRWCVKFGQAYADGLRRRRPRPGDKWHLDEVYAGHGAGAQDTSSEHGLLDREVGKLRFPALVMQLDQLGRWVTAVVEEGGGQPVDAGGVAGVGSKGDLALDDADL